MRINCNGCGLCVTNCPEGALQIIDGKARLVGELLCDGLGVCIGQCPEDAIYIEEREAEKYDESKVMPNIIKGGVAVIAAHLKHLKEHGQEEYYHQAVAILKQQNISIPFSQAQGASHGGCPGNQMIDSRNKKVQDVPTVAQGHLHSELGQWPIQLQLLNPLAPYFKDADIVIAADCVPFTYANFHQRFLRGKTLIIFCPKLDGKYEEYVEKLKNIFIGNSIKSVTLVHMEVPCCFGLVKMCDEALQQSGKHIILKEYNISLKGEII